MDYLDTSVLVAALTNETATEAVQSWLAARPVNDLRVSDWVATEFSSALSIKMRMGALDIEQRADALAYFRQLISVSLTILPIEASHFRTAARLTDQHQLGLRAGDALHLAIATEAGARLCTLDRRLAEAGREVGASVLLL